MDNLRKFIRIYTPFIVTLANLIYGVYYLKETLTEDIAFCINVPFGCSFSFVIYAWAASKRMCIWYKLNLLCNLLMLVDTVAYLPRGTGRCCCRPLTRMFAETFDVIFAEAETAAPTLTVGTTVEAAANVKCNGNVFAYNLLTPVTIAFAAPAESSAVVASKAK